MTPSIFLSLSFVDEEFVSSVYDRLPRGFARYFRTSFDRGEDLIAAMERNLDASEVFVLFASRAALKSFAVAFEIDGARQRAIFGKVKRVLVFPIESGLTFTDLPGWLQGSWVPNAGEAASDIARYLTTLLLEPDRGLSVAAPAVEGRGVTVDAARRLAAVHLQRHRASPRVYIFPGISGIGRRTFAAYYLRQGLGAEAGLPFGPSIQLSAQAELIDLYRALRVEINPGIPTQVLAGEQAAFLGLNQEDQIGEIMRIMSHFSSLRQAVTLVTAAGLFEDGATPKAWVAPLLKAVPDGQILIVVSNLQFRTEYVDDLENAVQMRIGELSSDDIRTLMIFTASLLEVEDFKISDRLVEAIGGHPDVANAAVRLAKQRGTAILERDPRQLFNVQRSIIGDSLRPEALSGPSRLILDVLGWLPVLGSDLLENIIVGELSVPQEEFNSAIESLVLGCLIYANGPRLVIANSVRQLYRRYNVAQDETVAAMARVFQAEWKKAEDQGFRDDLFSAFVFMHLLDGVTLPRGLRDLLTPSNLYDVVREAYARGKETESEATIQQAIEWGKLAFEMKMGEGLREEILSTVARAQIRLGHYSDATATIADMKGHHYRQVTFLEGHLLRKRRKFEDAIPKLRLALDNNRGNRAAVHELALCYRRLHRSRELEALLRENSRILDDSAQFLDFMIGLRIARNDLQSVPAAIERLRQLDDNPNRADLRQAQLLSKQGNDKGAFDYLSDTLAGGGQGSMRLRKARAVLATRIGRSNTARDDLAIIKAHDKGEGKAVNIEMQILLAEGRARDAYDLNRATIPQEPGDWLVRAAIFEAVAIDPATTLPDGIAMKREALEIRAKYSQEPEYGFDD
jgi:thioredoxin-like negative regulator of GroEL